MHTKASRIDGFPDVFYQKMWHIIETDVTAFSLEILNEGRSLDCINFYKYCSHSLSPSTETHDKFSSNIIYKIIAKVLANRFQNVLELCINKAQTTFVPRRLIFDNVLIAYEMHHSLRQKPYGRKGYITLKLNMSKTYERMK